jgi:hypothetical protein
LDGDWNRRELKVDPDIDFRSVDLNRPFMVEKRDLAISLEVAEHLDASSARGFIASLAAAADVPEGCASTAYARVPSALSHGSTARQ